jgi:hypothetical protein
VAKSVSSRRASSARNATTRGSLKTARADIEPELAYLEVVA